MITMNASVVAIVFLPGVLPGLAVEQAQADEPIKTTICGLVKSPEGYNHEIIAVRARINIAFENFTLSPSDCGDGKFDAVWLEYGKGPKSQPTIWCCGDMVPRDSLVLVQNAEFHRFHQYLTAEKRTKGVTTATFIR